MQIEEYTRGEGECWNAKGGTEQYIILDCSCVMFLCVVCAVVITRKLILVFVIGE